MALCPAHKDTNPSLKIIRDKNGVVLFHCFAGCEQDRVKEAIGLPWSYYFIHPPENDFIRMVKDVANWALSSPWNGRFGANDRAVFLVHLQVMLVSGKKEYGLSVRDIAEKVNISRTAASNANQRLLGRNLIEYVTKGRDGITIYRLHCNLDIHMIHDHVSQETLTFTCFSCNECQGYRRLPLGPAMIVQEIGEISHDLFSYRGLGQVGSHMFYLFRAGVRKVKCIAQATGRSVETIKTKLKTLDQIKGIGWHGDEWYPTLSLDEMSIRLGVSGRLEERKESHTEERKNWNDWLEDQREISKKQFKKRETANGQETTI
jgi:DNA-binding IscR family transcriptional regulator